ncbi:MAG TPA: holin [Planctomicrobium sp.]|nr:holin [Planctomicrobium sp.]
MMWTSKFWKSTAERAIKTFAQASVAALSGDQLGLFEVDWLGVLSLALLAAVLSVFSSIASAPVGEGDSPSLVK